MNHRYQIAFALLILTILFFPTHAGAEPPPSFDETLERFNAFVVAVGQMLDNIINDDSLSGIVYIQWTAFSVCLLVIVGVKYIFYNLTIYDLIQPLLMIAIVKILLDHYNFLTGLGWDLSEGIAGAIQQAAIGSRDPFLLSGFLIDLVRGIALQSGVSLLTSTLWAIISGSIVVVAVFLLSIVGFFANVWAMWGYVLSKIIGFFFIPFLMLKRTEFLFDGWLRLYSGFLVYGIIARANLVLVALAMKTLFRLNGYEIESTIQWDIIDIADILGLMSYMCIGIISLFCTGLFTAAVVSGSTSLGSAAGAVSSAATAVARIIQPK